MKPRVYIAGPISQGDLGRNIDQATAAFVALAKAGLAPFCPHWSVYSKPTERRFVDGQLADDVICEATAIGNCGMTHADWMGVDLPWVAVSQAVLRLPGVSRGADMEVNLARELAIPVFFNVRDAADYFAASSPTSPTCPSPAVVVGPPTSR